MKARIVLLFVLAVVVTTRVSAKTIHVAIAWTFNEKTGTWTSKDTGLTLTRKIVGFWQTRAEPMKKNGEAEFAYSSDRGAITLYIDHRLAAGFPATGDFTAAARDGYLEVMRKSYGKTDSEKSFRLRYSNASKRGVGVGTVCHFLSFSRTGGGPPAYSEVGHVLIGDFLFVYRGTFIDRAGLAELDRFLTALGVKKV
jgi:hypothetical protein